MHELTADDLKDLGVSLVGHRRKLLAAITALRRDGSLAAEPLPVAGPIPAPGMPAPASGRLGTTAPRDEGRAGGEAERRQLTVMFCDLVGSTELSSQLDPEDRAM